MLALNLLSQEFRFRLPVAYAVEWHLILIIAYLQLHLFLHIGYQVEMLPVVFFISFLLFHVMFIKNKVSFLHFIFCAL